MHSLDPIFNPRSVAVIGASRTPGTIGYQVVHNLITAGYTGAVYPVNPKAHAIHGVMAYENVEALPETPDLAVIAVPKESVIEVAEACGRRGVPGLVVITAGFREVGGAGVERERRLTEVARRHRMRLIGPNCLGILNTDAATSMNATFAPASPPRGPVSFMSQSGAMGVTVLDYAAEYGIGIRHFVSVGNKADVSGNDLIEYWAADPETRVILMYLENFGNPRKFTRIARAATRRTPILAVKAGRTVAGARAATSHTGSLAGAENAIHALMAQCGVIRVDTVEELFDLAMAFSHLPLPRDASVAIVTNAGGPGIIIADACEAAGLEVVALQESTQNRLRRTLPDEASVRNPVDMIATATGEDYRAALEAVLDDPGVGAAIAAFVPPLAGGQAAVADAIIQAKRAHPDAPVLAVLMGREGLPEGRSDLGAAGVPTYMFPESAARALAALNRYRDWRDRPQGTVRRFEIDEATAKSVLGTRPTTKSPTTGGHPGLRAHAARPAPDAGSYLSSRDTRRLLAAYGIPVAQQAVARSADEAVQLAAALDGPVVLKISSPDIVHKTDVGGVELDLRTEEEVRAAFARLQGLGTTNDAEIRFEGVTVEPLVRGGRETIIGMSLDPVFGPVLMFGLGGIYVEVLHDVVFRVQPVSDIDAAEMVRALRGVAVLEGVRGEPRADFDALAEAIERVSQLVGDNPEILELDINPFVVFEKGAIALDARIRALRPG